MTETVISNIGQSGMNIDGSWISAEKMNIKIILPTHLVYPACGVNAVRESNEKNTQF